MHHTYEQVQAACTVIAAHMGVLPSIGIILGSGLSDLVDDLQQPFIMSYRDIPGFFMPNVPGHRGELSIGMLDEQPIAVMRGRFHFYEGYSMQQVTFPVRVLQALGCRDLIITSAAGSLRSDWKIGDVMAITDQLFLPGLVGYHPLRGENDSLLGPRFPAMVGAFAPELIGLAHRVAEQESLMLREGIYAMVAGPSFESSAELRMLRTWGADIVGMSTAPEVIVARHAGMRVLGLSLLTNLALPDGTPASHAEVLAASEAARPGLARLLRGIITGMK